MQKILQRVLLAIGVVALIALFAEIAISVAATAHNNTAARVVHVQAGPYPLTVTLYKDPADAGYAMPFAISAAEPLSYDVTANPETDVTATAVHASTSPNDGRTNSVQGDAEITVRGRWQLHIVATGAQGQGVADIPITASAPPAIPEWLGWLIGGIIPLASFGVFLFMQRKRTAQVPEAQSEQVPVTL